MALKGYIIYNQQAIYYMTFTIVGWIDVFSRQSYRDIVIESFKYCQQYKGLHLHAYVIMSNHIHLIASVDEGKRISDFVRDCKKFTAKRILEEIQNSGIEAGVIGCCISLNITLPVIRAMKYISYGSMIIILLNWSQHPLYNRK